MFLVLREGKGETEARFWASMCCWREADPCGDKPKFGAFSENGQLLVSSLQRLH